MKALYFALLVVVFTLPGWALEVYPVPIGGLYPPTTDSSALLDVRLARPGPPPTATRARELLWSIRDGLQLSRIIDDSRYREYLTFELNELVDYAQATSGDQKAWTVLGVRYIQDRQYDAAFVAMSHARAIDPSDIRSAEIFSAVLVINDHIERATQENRRMLDAMPDNVTIRFNLVCALSLNGDYDEALHHLEFLALSGWDELIYNLYDRDLDNLVALPGFDALLDRTVEHRLQVLRQALIASGRK